MDEKYSVCMFGLLLIFITPLFSAQAHALPMGSQDLSLRQKRDDAQTGQSPPQQNPGGTGPPPQTNPGDTGPPPPQNPGGGVVPGSGKKKPRTKGYAYEANLPKCKGPRPQTGAWVQPKGRWKKKVCNRAINKREEKAARAAG